MTYFYEDIKDIGRICKGMDIINVHHLLSKYEVLVSFNQKDERLELYKIELFEEKTGTPDRKEKDFLQIIGYMICSEINFTKAIKEILVTGKVFLAVLYNKNSRVKEITFLTR